MSRMQFSHFYFQFGEDTAIHLAKTKSISATQIQLWLASIWKPAYWV